jgi:hypothetical protein
VSDKRIENEIDVRVGIMYFTFDNYMSISCGHFLCYV